MFRCIKEYAIKGKAERQLKSIINDIYRNPHLEFDEQLFTIGKNQRISIDSALYLFGKGLIDIPAPYDARINKSAFSYFTDKRRKFIDLLIIRIALPGFVSIITTVIISRLKLK